MKPKFQPIAFPLDCAPYGEQPFQPLVLPDAGYVVTGGPSALFVISMMTPPVIQLEVRAYDRISGFAVNEGHLYVQDGTVLSRWSMADARCLSAINVLQPKQRYTAMLKASAAGDSASGPPWEALHQLPDVLNAKREQLTRARRLSEWAALLQDALRLRQQSGGGPGDVIDTLWKLLEIPTAADTSGTDELVRQVKRSADARLSKASADAAALIVSAPVLRSHRIFGKRGAMVFVLGRDGALHPLDDKLEHLGTRRSDRGARAAIALAELPTSADSDEWACRLYYVDGDGGVQVLDGNALPPVELAYWSPTRVVADSPLRLRIVDNLLWGGGGHGASVFALPIDQPNAAPRFVVSAPPDDWHWLEVRREGDVPLALVSRGDSSRVLAYGKGVWATDRSGERDPVPRGFATFLPASDAPAPRGRPLLVLEVNEGVTGAGPNGVAFRVIVANTVDSPDAGTASLYRPTTKALFDGTLDAMAAGDALVPREVRTQPSVSKQDVYVIARALTASELVMRLLDPAQSDSLSQVLREINDGPNPAAILADTAAPIRSADALFCYPLGNSVTTEQAQRAWATLDEWRKFPKAIRLRLMLVAPFVSGPLPMRNTSVTLRFRNGAQQRAVTDSDGFAFLPAQRVGSEVTVESFWGGLGMLATDDMIRLDANSENHIKMSMRR